MVFYHAVKDVNFNYNFLNSEFINSVIQAIEEIDEEKVERIIQREFAFFKKKLLDPEIVQIYVNNIIYRSNKIIGKQMMRKILKLTYQNWKTGKIQSHS